MPTHEIETKVLEVDRTAITARLRELGATEIQQTTLVVDWYRPTSVTANNDPWYLRIRTNSSGKSEITWKAKSTILGVSRKHRELNILVDDANQFADLFAAIDLAAYAHQEKQRTSFKLNDWRFDLDQYPDMPAYLEIEGPSEASIQEAILRLDVADHETWNDGERTLIEQKYRLNWSDMRFTTPTKQLGVNRGK